MKLDDSISTNEKTILIMQNNTNNTKDFINKKSNFSEMTNTLTETKTAKMTEKDDVKKRASEFTKNPSFENIPIPTKNYQSSSFLSKVPSYFDNYKVSLKKFVFSIKTIFKVKFIPNKFKEPQQHNR